MRYVTLGAVVWCLMGAPASAQTQDAQLMAPIQKFIDSFNKGDMAGAAATHAASADLAITDEVPPFLWTGAQALKAWSTDLDADAKKKRHHGADGHDQVRRRASSPRRIRLMSSSLLSTPSRSVVWRCGKRRR